MSQVKIRAALQKALDTLTPTLATAKENQDFTPVTGTPYQALHLMPAMPDNAVMGAGMFIEAGILQVSLMYPLGQGTGPSQLRAELVRSLFKRGRTFVEAGVRVHCTKTPKVGPGFKDGDRWHLPISVHWHAYIAT